MNVKEPKYYRARIKALTERSSSTIVDENNKYFRNGFVPKNAQSLIDKRIKHFVNDVNNKPLSFAEITSYSTWFTMHPEKIAGIEVEATSRAFPVKLKGNKKDIENMFASVFSAKVSDESEAEALALALQIELELMDIELNGNFGTVYTQFKDKPKKAIKHLMKVKQGECTNALYRDDIGYIDIVWGENDKNNKGFGLVHIIEKHQKEIKQFGFNIEDFIPIVVQFGNLNLSEQKRDKIILESKGFRVVIKTKWNDEEKQFLLSTFDLRPIKRKNA